MVFFDFLLLQSDWLSVFFHEDVPNMNDWPLIDVVSFPQQDEGSLDYGVFLMKVIEHIALDNKINFSKEDMPKFRSEIAAKILKHSKIQNYINVRKELPRCEEGGTINLM